MHNNDREESRINNGFVFEQKAQARRQAIGLSPLTTNATPPAQARRRFRLHFMTCTVSATSAFHACMCACMCARACSAGGSVSTSAGAGAVLASAIEITLGGHHDN